MKSDHQDPRVPPPQPLSLRRWSQRKLEATRSPLSAVGHQASAPPTISPDLVPLRTTSAEVPAQLPPVESLTFESEFAQFFEPTVEETVKRAALKQLLRHPRFNTMDGLDVYIDDYTTADPIPPDMLNKLVHSRYIFDPPQTEVTTEGHVIDKPPKNPDTPVQFGQGTSATFVTGRELVPDSVLGTSDAEFKVAVADASPDGARS